MFENHKKVLTYRILFYNQFEIFMKRKFTTVARIFTLCYDFLD